MKTLNKKIIFLIGFLFVTLISFSNIANAACPMYPDEVINPTISITGVSVTDGIVTLSVSFTAGTCIWYDEDGNITTICHGEITGLRLYIYTSDGNKFGEVNASTDPIYSGSDTLQWVSPSFAQDNYTLKVYAQGTITISAPATTTVFINNPLPRITSPADGSTVQGVVDVTCEFFSTKGMRELWLEVYDAMCPYCKRVSHIGHIYFEPYPTSGTYTFHWQSQSFTQGAYNLVVFASEYYGATGRAELRYARSEPVTVIIGKTPPTASFTYSPENPLIYDEITFDASLSDDEDGEIVKYEWDFGDGNSAEGQVVGHSYAEPGEYTVNLTVTDNDGLTDSVRSLVSVSVREPEQMVEPVKGCVTSGFGERMRNGENDDHKGIDIAWPNINEAEIVAPAGGWVDNFDYVAGKDGYWLRIRHPKILRRDGTVVSNVYTYYCHLLEKPDLEKGGWVNQGEVIAHVGNTGNSDAPHLHYMVKEGGIPADPTKYVEYPGCKELKVEAHSPVDIRLVDPDGYIVSKTLIEIEMTATYLEEDFDGDGKTDDRIWLTDRKAGDYWITVLPDPNAQPNDTYSLGVIIDGQTMVLAQDVQIQHIPSEPYKVESKLCYSDFDSDGDVDFVDYAVFASHCMDTDCNYPSWCEGTDLDYSHKVDFNDLDIFVDSWLWEKIPADIDMDGDVDSPDYAAFADHWMDQSCIRPSWCSGADIDKSGKVDFFDLALLVAHWLEDTGPE